MSQTLSQKVFSRGELSPQLYARADIDAYFAGLRTCRNFEVMSTGGVQNRPGFEFMAEVKDSSVAVRLIPFKFNSSQTYVIELGNLYARFYKNGAQVRESTKTITNITQANPAVVTTSGAHGYATDEEVYITGVVGMTQVNGRNFKITVLSGTTFSLQAMDSTTNIDSTGYTAYGSAGTSARVYEIVTTYATADLSTLKFAQSADVIRITHPTYPVRKLTRTADTSWTIADEVFLPAVTHPVNQTLTTSTAGSLNYSYKVTAVGPTGEESLSGTHSTAKTVTGITKANPGVVTTSAAHSFVDGYEILFPTMAGMTELSSRRFMVRVASATTFSLIDANGVPVDTTNYTTFTSGTVIPTSINLTNSASPSSSAPVTINLNYSSANRYRYYNIYRSGAVQEWYWIGSAPGNASSFIDSGYPLDTSKSAPKYTENFFGANNYPSAIAMIQQRLMLANTNTYQEVVWGSRIGYYTNFTDSNPINDDDTISFKAGDGTVSPVVHLLNAGKLFMMTREGEVLVGGAPDGVLTPFSLVLDQQDYWGCADVRPVLAQGNIVFLQGRSTKIIGLSYEYEKQSSKGKDLSIMSSHLFDGFTIVDMDYQKTPHSTVWCVRSDGKMLGLTYIPSENILGWHRHDTDGNFENVCVVPESNEDAVYVVVKRTIGGATKRYVERKEWRYKSTDVDYFHVDSGVTVDGDNTGSTTMTLSGGTVWDSSETLTLTASAAYFASTDVGDAIHLTSTDGTIVRFSIVTFSSTTVVTGTVNVLVPSDLRSAATTTWAIARVTLRNLWHLEGESLSIYADGYVVASPNNDDYSALTVTNGVITLPRPYAVVHAGLPYLSDIETMDINSRSGSLTENQKIANRLALDVEKTRGLWVGAKPPDDDSTNPRSGLSIINKALNKETVPVTSQEAPIDLLTDIIAAPIPAKWNSNGRVFIRQIDPVPATINSINPTVEV